MTRHEVHEELVKLYKEVLLSFNADDYLPRAIRLMIEVNGIKGEEQAEKEADL